MAMILRIARRTPWMALGAVGGFYFDPERGRRRRQDLGRRASRWAGALRDLASGSASASLETSGARAASDGGTMPTRVATLGEDDDRVRARAAEPLAEETAAGVPSPAPTAMAERILEESEARMLGRPQ